MTNGGICKITLFLYIQLPFIINADILLPNATVSLRYMHFCMADFRSSQAARHFRLILLHSLHRCLPRFVVQT